MLSHRLLELGFEASGVLVGVFEPRELGAAVIGVGEHGLDRPAVLAPQPVVLLELRLGLPAPAAARRPSIWRKRPRSARSPPPRRQPDPSRRSRRARTPAGPCRGRAPPPAPSAHRAPPAARPRGHGRPRTAPAAPRAPDRR